MPENSDPPDLETAMAECIAHFSIRRDLAFEVLVQLEEAPFGKLRSAALRIAEQHPGPVTTALLKLARRSGDENPLRETQLARLALKIARGTDLPANVKRALFAEAEALIGDGWRRRRDLREAERAFVRAAHHLEEVSDPDENALYLDLLAHLREDQHRPEEARALWERAASLFGEIGQIDDQAEVLLAKAALEICLADVESALTDLRTVLALTDRELRPDLAAIAVLGYGTLLGQMRRTAEALAVIGAFREHYSAFGTIPRSPRSISWRALC
jgi:tetratricopeptide (TPR) repeat protein